jgi:hypothetical protein
MNWKTLSANGQPERGNVAKISAAGPRDWFCGYLSLVVETYHRDALHSWSGLPLPDRLYRAESLDIRHEDGDCLERQ